MLQSNRQRRHQITLSHLVRTLPAIISLKMRGSAEKIGSPISRTVKTHHHTSFDGNGARNQNVYRRKKQKKPNSLLPSVVEKSDNSDIDSDLTRQCQKFLKKFKPVVKTKTFKNFFSFGFCEVFMPYWGVTNNRT